LYVNRAHFNVDLATVESNFLSPHEAAIDEMVDSSREMIPDAPEVNRHRFQSTPALPPSLMDLRLIPPMMKMKMLLLVLPNRKKLYIFLKKKKNLSIYKTMISIMGFLNTLILLGNFTFLFPCYFGIWMFTLES
jgi:hypothetical protein